MRSFLRAATAKVNEKSDNEVGAAGQVLVHHSPVACHLFSDHAGIKLLAAAQVVISSGPCAHADQYAGHVQCLLDRLAIDAQQPVAGVNAGVGSAAARTYVLRLDPALAVRPNRAIFGKTMKLKTLFEVNGGRDDRRNGRDGEQRGR